MRQIRTDDQGTCSGPINHKSKPRILVGDDDPQVATVIRDILLHEGYEVEIARSGRQALELLEGGKDLDLLITDMRMPETDGLELLREIHFWKGRLPVIVLAGFPTVKNEILSLMMGAHEHLAKPFEIKALLRVVESALKGGAQRRGWTMSS
jgi:DNA-binding response OmpR family regulator